MVREFKTEDIGKKVMTADGDMVGTVDTVEGNDIHVKPDAALSGSTRQTLGWTGEDEDVYPLSHSSVDEISGEEIHLKRDL